ncbi:MAG: 8-amino-7-oxononanoate synthase [Gammaproteobacteria bacterium]|nr:8-amino-7-oxononanoate synthase [Gammaproteobacteria bacterium]
MLTKKLNANRAQHLTRARMVCESRRAQHIGEDQRSYINFTSNDYLGLATDPRVKKAMIDGINQYGVGSGSSPVVSGYYQSTRALEEQFADFLKRDRAVLFNSGYHANCGLFSAIADRHTSIIADKFLHASLLDGIRLSRAKLCRFQHHHAQHASQLLEKNWGALFVTESVSSMSGEICPLPEYLPATKKYQAITVLDDAHGIGILGELGAGGCDQFNLQQSDIHFLITPLAKALGTMGALVSGSHAAIESLIQFARTYHYSSALPPAIPVATLAALKILQTENWRRDQLKSLIQHFIREAKNRNLPLTSDDLTPIKSIIIGGNAATSRLVSDLRDHHFLVACIRPPTVPNNTARIRISLNCMQKESDITALLDFISRRYHHAFKACS